MATTGESYVLGYSRHERERLVRQAALHRVDSAAFLDQIGLRPGWRALDVGCGPLGVLDLLAERVGPGGEVVGVDQEEQTLAMARDFAAEQGLANVRLVRGDARATGLPRDAFDLAHARLVLVTVPDPARILAELVALVRPGGVVAVQDIDVVSWCCEPTHPSFDALLGAFLALRREGGQDSHLGRRLRGLLRAAGLTGVEMVVRARAQGTGGVVQSQLPTIARGIRDAAVARGLFTAEEFAAHQAALDAHLADPETITVSSLMFQVWGRKPA